MTNPGTPAGGAYDVVIVGGGIAGLTTALQLIEDAGAAGLAPPRIKIFEADQTLGGRVKDTTLSDGTVINAGAGWLHGGASNELFQHVAERYGDALGPLVDDDATNRVWISGEGLYDARLKDIATEQLNEAYAAFKAANPGKDISLAGLARICAEKHGTGHAQAFASYMATAWMAVDRPEQVSYDEFYNDPNGSGGKILKNGMARIIDCMAAELKKHGVDIKTGLPVAAMRNTADGVELTDIYGEKHTAAKAVVTASVAVLKNRVIAFEDSVTQKIDPYLGGLDMAKMTKITVPLKPAFFESRGIAPNTFMSVLDADPMFLCHAATGGKPTLTVFQGGSAGTAMESLRGAALNDKAAEYLDRIPQLAGYRDYMTADAYATPWSDNIYVQGAYSAALPGAKRSDPITAENITFAGEAFVADPNKSPSQMTGAWASGKLAAGHVFSGIKAGLEPAANRLADKTIRADRRMTL